MTKPQLFCFTYAGGSASFFDVIEKDLPEYEFVKIEYAGHGTRHREPLYKSFDELATDIYEHVCKYYSGGKFALFGYSMGAITLVEVLKKLMVDTRMSLPSHLFLAAHEPQSKKELSGFTGDELDEWIKKRTIRFGAVPDKLVNNKSFWRFYLPLYRADYSIIGKYKFEDLDFRINVPASIFYSETDTPRQKMELWKRYFTGQCEFYEFEGTHFFIKVYHQAIAKVMRQCIYIGD